MRLHITISRARYSRRRRRRRRRYTLAIVTEGGRRLIFDPLTKAQPWQLTDIARRILRAIDPADSCLDHPGRG
jgi:hypothetical protein